MGDGTAKGVGLSLAKSMQIFLLNWLSGGCLKHADLTLRLQPGLLDFPDVLLSTQPHLKLKGLRPHPFTPQILLHQFPFLDDKSRWRSNQSMKELIAGTCVSDQNMRQNDGPETDRPLQDRHFGPEDIVEKISDYEGYNKIHGS